MFEAGDSASGQLELTDPDIEDSSVLSSVLDLVYGKEIDVSWRGPANKSAPCIVLALQKYDCKNALTLIRLLIRNETLSRHNTGMWLFEAAVLLQDWETCHELIGDSGHWKFNGPFGGKDDVDEPRWGVMGAMNPVNWSTSRFERTPARVTRALLRGIEKGRNRSDDIDWEVVADEFKRILQVSCDFSYYRNLRISTGYVSS